MGGCGTTRGAVSSDDGRHGGKRTGDRKLGAGERGGPAADQPVDCFRSWLRRRPLGAEPCEALTSSSWPLMRRSLGCAPWRRVKAVARLLARSPSSSPWPSWHSRRLSDGRDCGFAPRPFRPLLFSSVSISSSLRSSVCWLRAHHRGMPSGKRCRYVSKLWMPLGDRFSSPQLCRPRPHCSASFAEMVVGDRGFGFSDDEITLSPRGTVQPKKGISGNAT